MEVVAVTVEQMTFMALRERIDAALDGPGFERDALRPLLRVLEWKIEEGLPPPTSAQRADHLRTRQQVVSRLRWQIENKVSLPRSGLPWVLLPSGTWSSSQLAAKLESVTRRPMRYEDRERLERIIRELRPDACHIGVGRNNFEGYVAFTFRDSDMAILDSPMVGNAVFVLKQDWQALSRLTKRELLDSYREDVQRVVHVGAWLSRIKEALGRPHWLAA